MAGISPEHTPSPPSPQQSSFGKQVKRAISSEENFDDCEVHPVDKEEEENKESIELFTHSPITANSSFEQEALAFEKFAKVHESNFKFSSRTEILFDSGAEFTKSLVREMFLFQEQMFDGACAAILHVT